MSILPVLAVLAALASSHPVSAATQLAEQQKLAASNGTAFDFLGAAVAMDGDTLVAGAPEAGFWGPDSGTYGNGAAYVYRLSNGAWTDEDILTASDGFLGQLFANPAGEVVAIAGDTIVVGAMADDDHGASSGAAYVYERSGTSWSETQKLTASDAAAQALFGESVAISADGNTIVVGARSAGQASPGAAYVFVRGGSGWEEGAKLTASDGAAFDEFGWRVEIAGDTIAISSWYNDNANGTNAGAIYVFGLVGGEWEEQAKLTLANGQPNWLLGWALGISPDTNTIVASTAANLEGGVYVFEREGSGWSDSTLLVAPMDEASWLPGDGLAINDDTILVGHSAMNEEIGGAHIYRRSGATWTLAHRLAPSDGAPGDFNGQNVVGDWAGTSVAMSGGNIAVGSPWHDDTGQDSGAVYVFRDPGPEPDEDIDGVSDDLESGFGGSDPNNSLMITNPATGDMAYLTGSAEEGATLYSGSFGIELPPGSSVDTDEGASQIEITLVPGTVARVEVSGADLGGSTKSILMPFDGAAQYPAVCIDDSPTASIDAIVIGGTCSATAVPIPPSVGASNTVASFTVTRLPDNRVRVDGLSHTALATLDAGSAAPVVESIAAGPALVTVNSTVTADAVYTDADDGDTHTAIWQWGDGTTSSGTVNQGTNAVAGNHQYAEPGVYTVSVTVTDPASGGLSASADFHYVVVYDPAGGFVTGGGWFDSPAGAYVADPSLTGKATFGFVAKYKNGKSVPEGNTEFQFKARNLNFKSTGDYMWLVVSGSGHKATYKGTGKVNGAGSYGFMVTAIDAANTPSTDVDLFRIKIWDKNDGDTVVYDNQLGTDCGTGDDADACTALGGGSIVIHKN